MEMVDSATDIETRLSSMVEVRESRIGGKGCFALKPIKQGEIIHLLSGELLAGNEVDTRIISGQSRPDDELQIDDDLFLALDEPSYFFNHSCEPNGGIRNKSELFALRDIDAGEELTYDYATTVGIEKAPGWILKNNDWSMECRCGAESCRREIKPVTSVPEETLQRYLNVQAFPDFIKRQLASSLPSLNTAIF